MSFCIRRIYCALSLLSSIFLLAACVLQQPKIIDQSSVVPLNPNMRPALVSYLNKQGVQVIQRGGSLRIILPSDQFFVGQSPELTINYLPSLAAIAKLLRTYTVSCEPPYIWVTAYTDNVGSLQAKKLRSYQQAYAVTSFLVSQGIPAKIMQIQSGADKNAISNNRIVGGSADNRRVEITIPQPFQNIKQ